MGETYATDPFTQLGVDIPKARIQAPEFTLNKLKDGKASLTDYRGKVVLLNFWATWCAPCREEMPAIQRLWERFRAREFVVIAIALDRGSRKSVVSFVDKLALNYPILLDPKGDVRNRYEVVGLPMSYLIGRDGKISGRIIGIREWDHPDADAMVTTLLAQ